MLEMMTTKVLWGILINDIRLSLESSSDEDEDEEDEQPVAGKGEPNTADGRSALHTERIAPKKSVAPLLSKLSGSSFGPSYYRV